MVASTRNTHRDTPAPSSDTEMEDTNQTLALPAPHDTEWEEQEPILAIMPVQHTAPTI